MKTIALISTICFLLYVWQLRPIDSPSNTNQQELKTSLLSTATTFRELEESELLPARAYPKWKYDFPCYHGSTVGLIYIKVKKAASTSMFNIVERISYRRDKANRNRSPRDMNHNKQCKNHDTHIPAFRLNYAKKHTENKAFLFTFVREPTQR